MLDVASLMLATARAFYRKVGILIERSFFLTIKLVNTLALIPSKPRYLIIKSMSITSQMSGSLTILDVSKV